MPIQKDPQGVRSLRETIGRRLRNSRRAAGLSQLDAAHKLGHKGVTQISLSEDGSRMPPLLDLMKLADLYCVPLDFIVGRIDDPIAEAEEHTQGLIVRSVSHAIGECVDMFTKATSEHVAVVLAGQGEDRRDVLEAIQLSKDAEAALDRIREMNPEYEDLKGGSRLEMALSGLKKLGTKMEQRVRREREQRAMIDTAIRLDTIEASIKQFNLEFQTTECVS